jgi:ribosomal protein L34E
MSGECINSGLDVPTLIDKVTLEKTPKGSTYYCYERRGQKNRQCSDIASVATVAEIQAERNGNFQVVADNDKILVVKCSEGGRVYIEKGAQWLRKSAVFFGSIEDLPVERKVNQDKESAARDGCKGQDGPPH